MSVPVVFDLTTRLGRRRARTAFVDRGKAVPICWSCATEILGEKGTVVLAFPERPATKSNLRIIHALCKVPATGERLEARKAGFVDAAAERARGHADRERGLCPRTSGCPRYPTTAREWADRVREFGRDG